MKEALRIAELFRGEQRLLGQAIQVQGWVRTRRDSKAGISFIEVNDGSCMKNLQVIVELDHPELADAVKNITTGASVRVEGVLKA